MIFAEIENGHGFPVSILPVAGTISFNAPYVRGDLTLFYVKATTATTQFDVKIIDKRGRVIRHYQKEIGLIRDEGSVGIVGKHTITIENSTVDEAFDVLMKVKEIG